MVNLGRRVLASADGGVSSGKALTVATAVMWVEEAADGFLTAAEIQCLYFITLSRMASDSSTSHQLYRVIIFGNRFHLTALTYVPANQKLC